MTKKRKTGTPNKDVADTDATETVSSRRYYPTYSIRISVDDRQRLQNPTQLKYATLSEAVGGKEEVLLEQHDQLMQLVTQDHHGTPVSLQDYVDAGFREPRPGRMAASAGRGPEMLLKRRQELLVSDPRDQRGGDLLLSHQLHHSFACGMAWGGGLEEQRQLGEIMKDWRLLASTLHHGGNVSLVVVRREDTFDGKAVHMNAADLDQLGGLDQGRVPYWLTSSTVVALARMLCHHEHGQVYIIDPLADKQRLSELNNAQAQGAFMFGNRGHHWWLVHIDIVTRRIGVYDSMASQSEQPTPPADQTSAGKSRSSEDDQSSVAVGADDAVLERPELRRYSAVLSVGRRWLDLHGHNSRLFIAKRMACCAQRNKDDCGLHGLYTMQQLLKEPGETPREQNTTAFRVELVRMAYRAALKCALAKLLPK